MPAETSKRETKNRNVKAGAKTLNRELKRQSGSQNIKERAETSRAQAETSRAQAETSRAQAETSRHEPNVKSPGPNVKTLAKTSKPEPEHLA